MTQINIMLYVSHMAVSGPAVLVVVVDNVVVHGVWVSAEVALNKILRFICRELE